MMISNEMTFHVSYIYNEACLGPACEKSYALFQLINRGSLKMNEISLISKMGFTVHITGDETKRFKRESRKVKELGEDSEV
jgi:hypothetical protein